MDTTNDSNQNYIQFKKLPKKRKNKIIGSKVKHDEYGIGYIIKVNFEKLDIVFENFGKKTIIEDYVEMIDD